MICFSVVNPKIGLVGTEKITVMMKMGPKFGFKKNKVVPVTIPGGQFILQIRLPGTHRRYLLQSRGYGSKSKSHCLQIQSVASSKPSAMVKTAKDRENRMNPFFIDIFVLNGPAHNSSLDRQLQM